MALEGEVAGLDPLPDDEILRVGQPDLRGVGQQGHQVRGDLVPIGRTPVTDFIEPAPVLLRRDRLHRLLLAKRHNALHLGRHVLVHSPQLGGQPLPRGLGQGKLGSGFGRGRRRRLRGGLGGRCSGADETVAECQFILRGLDELQLTDPALSCLEDKA